MLVLARSLAVFKGNEPSGRNVGDVFSGRGSVTVWVGVEFGGKLLDWFVEILVQSDAKIWTIGTLGILCLEVA